jgi:hypothetical protein
VLVLEWVLVFIHGVGVDFGVALGQGWRQG